LAGILVEMDDRYRQEKVWDIVTRVWHWMLVISVTSGWLLGEFRNFSVMQWHIYFGYATGILLLWRFLWGLIGPESARLRALVPGFCEVKAYLKKAGRREPSGVAGHNPIGAISVLVMLLLLSIQVVSGLFSEDDGLFYAGPLAEEISGRGVKRMTSIHHQVSELLLIFVGLHIVAVIFYLFWKKENLIKPMLSGWKWVKNPSDSE